MHSSFSPKKFLYFAFPCLSIILNLEVYDGVYFSTLLLGFFFLTQLLGGKAHKHQLILYAGMVFFLWIVLIKIIFFEGDLSVLRSEYLKIVILLCGTSAIVGLPENARNNIVLSIPWILFAYMVTVYLFFDWNGYDQVRNRFTIPSIGSPNSLAFMLAICLILMHYQKSIIISRSKIAYFVCYTSLLAGLIATQSRGGIVIYLIGLIFIQRNSFFIFAFCSGLLLLFLLMVVDFLYSQNFLGERLNLVQDLAATGGTGRLEIWGYLIGQLLKEPGSLLFGIGPVHVELFGAEISSAHSAFVNIFYCFGAFGVFALFGFVFWGAGLLIKSNGKSVKYRRALYFMFVAGIFFDSYIFNAQIFWFTCLILALIYGVAEENGEILVENRFGEVI